MHYGFELLTEAMPSVFPVFSLRDSPFKPFINKYATRVLVVSVVPEEFDTHPGPEVEEDIHGNSDG